MKRVALPLWVSLCLVWASVAWANDTSSNAASGQLVFYKIPNPFTNPRQEGFYYIRSHQTVISRENKRTTLEVNEYFSLTKGFSYSVYRDLDGEGEYALVSDGKQDRSYIIRNPSEENEKNLACELDAVHHHRQVFPWQFNYDLSRAPGAANDSSTSSGPKDDGSFSSKRQKRNKRKSGWWLKRSVYGVGAIWLNAVELKLVSDKVGDRSPYAEAQPWTMTNNDMTIELLFPKPENTFENPEEMQRIIDATRLSSVHIKRVSWIDTDSSYMYGENVVGASADEIIEIDEFVMDLDEADDGIKRMYAHLKQCRRANQEHRVFPSLLRAISLSPKHMYELDYLETRFGSVAWLRQDNKYRKVYNPELIFELFSMPYETQVIDYQGVINQTANQYDDRVDSYMKLFTERASGQRSTRRATVQYHIVRQPEAQDTCVDNEPDPPPRWLNLLMRPIRFARANDVQITGVITGLGALLMNANDIHYKQFNLLQKTIEVVYDAANINARVKLTVDEWRLEYHGEYRIHFYFKKPESARAGYDLKSLVRAEVRHIKQEQSKAPVENAADDDLKDDNLMIRWDVLGFYVENSDESLEFFFKKPYFCPDSKKPAGEEEGSQDDSTGGGKDEEDFATEPPFELPENEQLTDDDVTNPDEEDYNADENDDQKRGEDLEFEPGMTNEGAQMPDFFEQFTGSRVAFTAVSKIELSQPEANSKTVYLRESVDMDANLARVSVFLDKYEEKEEPDYEYYLNYNSELVLKIKGKTCAAVENLEPWLRLLSVDLPYWKRWQSGSEESHKLRLYGVGAMWRFASMSGEAKFIGQTKTLNDTNGAKYKRLYWTTSHDSDPNMELVYEFRLDVSEAEKGRQRTKEVLSLESILFDNYYPNSDYESSWDNVKISLIKLEHFTWLQVYIPNFCDSALEDKSNPFFHLNSTMPSFSDYLNGSTDYVAHYYVTKTNASLGEGIYVEQMGESFDLKSRRGRITSGTGEQTREVFVDGHNGCIYLYAKGSCKLVKTILAFNTGLDLVDYHHNSDSNSWFGLANLWQVASAFENPIKKTFYDYDRLGNHIHRCFYYVKVETDRSVVNVNFQFTLKGGDQLQLDQIEIKEMLSYKRVAATKMSRTTISVVDMRKDIKSGVMWNLPDECTGLCGPQPASTDGKPKPPSVLNEFPELTKIVAPLGRFYMRSEVVLSEMYQVDAKSNNYYIMDEWYYNGDYRIKSYRAGKNFDEIVYPTSNEQFDISEENLCKNKHALANDPMSTARLPALLGLWKGGKPVPGAPVEYHFGPVSLWRLAEANKNSLKLMSQVDFTPSTQSMEEQEKALELEMGRRVWRLTDPNNAWYADLEFPRHSVIDKTGARIQWLTLKRITVSQAQGAKVFSTEIEVVDYKYSKTDDEMQQKLLLPEGHGCQRSEKKMESLGSIQESVQMFQSMSHFIWYESSLEKIVFVDSDYGKIALNRSRSVLPSITGTFYKSPKWMMPPHINIWSNFNSIRYPNGTRQSTKTVHDTLNRIDYKIDRATGYCETSVNENTWTLEYPSLEDETVETLTLDDNTFDHLFKRTGSFQPLNRYERGNSVFISYEDSGDSLNLTSGLVGPYSIVRRFEYNKNLVKYSVKNFDSMLVKVFMFDQKRVEKKAILTFNLRRISNVPFNQILEAVDVSTCFNNGDEVSENPVRSFSMEYECNKTGGDLKRRSTTSIQDTFSISLIEETRIFATQLVGAPKLEMSDAGSMKFTFNLIDAPTYILQDTKHYPKKRMCAQYESVAQVKTTSSLLECSKLCDNLKCLAMSYCSNRFCYTVTQEDISNDSVVLLEQPVQDSDCDYYYLEHPRAPTVDSVREILDKIEPEQTEKVEIFPLWTGEYCGLLYPIKVTELTEPLDFEGSTGAQRHLLESRYNEIGRNRVLDLAKLDTLVAKGFRHSIESAESSSSCINHCQVQDCVMVSFCRMSSQEACIVVTGSGDPKELVAAVGEDQRDGCLVMARDYTSEFKRFTNTTRPSSSVVQYQGYSDKECAAMCVFRDSTSDDSSRCLSFDHCLIRSPQGEVQETCHIQTSHMYSYEFERKIFEGTKIAKATNTELHSCQHFSRYFLADYQKLAGRRLKVRYTQIEEGIEADRCSYNCNNDDDCYAFVHCAAGTGGSCLLLRNAKERRFTCKDEAMEYLKEESQESKTCSIYVRNQVKQEAANTLSNLWDPYLSALKPGSLVVSNDEGFDLVKFIIRLTVYLHVALIGGIIIQVVVLRMGTSR